MSVSEPVVFFFALYCISSTSGDTGSYKSFIQFTPIAAFPSSLAGFGYGVYLVYLTSKESCYQVENANLCDMHGNCDTVKNATFCGASGGDIYINYAIAAMQILMLYVKALPPSHLLLCPWRTGEGIY